MMRQETHPEQDFTLQRDSLSIIRRKRAINDLSREDHFDRTLIQIVHERSSSLSLFADNLESIRFSERGAFEFGQQSHARTLLSPVVNKCTHKRHKFVGVTFKTSLVCLRWRLHHTPENQARFQELCSRVCASPLSAARGRRSQKSVGNNSSLWRSYSKLQEKERAKEGKKKGRRNQLHN